MPSLFETGPVILEKILKFPQYIFVISHLSPHGKGRGPSLNKLESSSPKDALCQDWLKFDERLWKNIVI